MPNIRPISDLRNNANDISEICNQTREPVFITKNGVGDMVVMSLETYERQQALINLYAKTGRGGGGNHQRSTGRGFLGCVKAVKGYGSWTPIR